MVAPLQMSNLTALIERDYRSVGDFQSIREAGINAYENGATEVVIDIDWGYFTQTGFACRTITDNGSGMTPSKLKEYFANYSSSSKSVGGEHGNFGIGAKLALLPCNHRGVIIRTWKDGKLSVMWQRFENGEYGPRDDGAFEADTVIVNPAPGTFVDGIDIGTKPELIDQHGTQIILLGSDEQPHSYLGAANRRESAQGGVIKYLSNHFFKLPKMNISVLEFNDHDESKWPSSKKDVNAYRYVTATDKKGAILDAMESMGSMTLKDTSVLHWFIHDAEFKNSISCAYSDELYDTSGKLERSRLFGLSKLAARSRVTIVIEGAKYDKIGKAGVYPNGARSTLLYAKVNKAPRALPWDVWGSEFVKNMPEEVKALLLEDENVGSNSAIDLSVQNELMDKIKNSPYFNGKTWRKHRKGEDTITPLYAEPVAPSGSNTRNSKARPVSNCSPRRGSKPPVKPNSSTIDGDTAARSTTTAHALPTYQWGLMSDVGDSIACWVPTPNGSGQILIARDHPVVLAHVAKWIEQEQQCLPEIVEQMVKNYMVELLLTYVVYVLCDCVGDEQKAQLTAPALSAPIYSLPRHGREIKNRIMKPHSAAFARPGESRTTWSPIKEQVVADMFNGGANQGEINAGFLATFDERLPKNAISGIVSRLKAKDMIED